MKRFAILCGATATLALAAAPAVTAGRAHQELADRVTAARPGTAVVDEVVVEPAHSPDWITCKAVMRGMYNMDVMTDCSTSRGVSRSSGKNFYVFTIKDKSKGFSSRFYFWGSPLKNGRSSVVAFSTDESPPASTDGECFVFDEEEGMACNVTDRTGTTLSIKTEKW